MIEDKEDFFEDTPTEKPKVEKPPKKPRYKDDDPRYYEEEESRWEHLKPSPYRRGPYLLIALATVIVIGFVVGLYIWLFTPKVQEAVEFGYVENIQKEGTLFNTYEGVILPYKALMDSTRNYEGDFVFSTKDEKLATKLLRSQGNGWPVRVEYKVYRVRLPWRGKTEVTVTRADSVPNPSKILPPQRRPPIAR